MISLKLQDTPFIIDAGDGISFTVRPLSTFDMNVAQAAARISLEKLETSLEEVYNAGLLPRRDIDLTDQAVRDALYYEFLIGELAERHIIGWAGVNDEDGNPVPVETSGARRMVMRLFPVGSVFYKTLTLRHMEMLAAKKDCGTAASGTSAAVPDIARDADAPETPAPMESRD